MAEKELKKYRLKGKGFTVPKRKGPNKIFKKGDLVPLTESQYKAFKDQFEPADKLEKELAALKKEEAKKLPPHTPPKVETKDEGKGDDKPPAPPANPAAGDK